MIPNPHFIYWESEGAYLGYFVEYPEYWTQGDSLADIKAHLNDLECDLKSGMIPKINREPHTITTSDGVD